MKYGLFINERERLSFSFDGMPVAAMGGDTIASALWRAGISTVSRSFKYHRRRGSLSLSAADAGSLVDADGAPNVCAARALVKNGMRAQSNHCIGGAENDRLAFMQYLSPFLPPGFYYKAFFRPAGIWPKWEPLIRRLAGLGEARDDSPRLHWRRMYETCDTAIVGGGAAGMQAALAAAKKGERVVLLDRNPLLGGAMNWRGERERAAAMEKSADAAANIKVMRRCEATGVFDNCIFAHCETAGEERIALRLRARKIIFATGARNLPAVFANNDLPGAMLLSAALRLAFLYDVQCGRRTVAMASSDSDAAAIRLLQNYGADIVAVFNLASPDAEWALRLAADGFAVHSSVSQFSARGRRHVSGVCAAADGRDININCDCILMSGGDIPVSELPAAAGMPFAYDDRLRKPVALHSKKTFGGGDDAKNFGGDLNCNLNYTMILAGALNHRGDLRAALLDGEAAGEDGDSPPADDSPLPANVFFAGGGGKAFVDYEEDLQLSDLDCAVAEGFDDIQLLKRYTTAGMGPAQGKLGNVLVVRRLAETMHCPPSSAGQITARPPAAAETLAQLAEEPTAIKQTPMHESHLHLSATMMNAGAWRRPAFYTSPEKEAQTVRESAGVIDISTLGKIQVSGKDAAELLERLYTGRFANQKPGTVRYALMLDESGVIADDGVAARLDDNTFFVSATTGNADNVYRQMLLWRARWGLRADIINLTSAYGAMNLAGPDAPAIFADIAGAELAALPFMKNARATIGGAEALVMPVGFVGEKGYEIHLPAGAADSLWQLLLRRAAPFGVEAQRLLRLEKGHAIIGQDTDGLTTPLEAEMQWALADDKPFYFGGRAMQIHRRRPPVRRLRGFVLDEKWRRHVGESDLILDSHGDAVGQITSLAYSPARRCLVGLAYAPADTPKRGGEIRIRAAGGEVLLAKTEKPPFYDPEGKRLK